MPRAASTPADPSSAPSSGPGVRRQGWSEPQRTLFLRACSAAGWTAQQRYIAMRHAGCPSAAGKGRPSVSAPGNGQGAFERVMALAEASASMRGACVPPPKAGGTWQEVAAKARGHLERKAVEMTAEAIRRMPGVVPDDALAKTIRHVTQGDSAELPIETRPISLDECDEGQLYRIVESLRAHLGRLFAARGLTPASFEIPRSARARAAAGPRSPTPDP